MGELWSIIKQFADKICFSSKIARNLVIGVLVLAVLLMVGLSTDPISNAVEYYITKQFPSNLIPLYGITTIHYGIGLYLYVISVTIILVLLILSITWSVIKCKEVIRYIKDLKEIVEERRAS